MKTFSFESKKLHQKGITLLNPLFHFYLTTPWKSVYTTQEEEPNLDFFDFLQKDIFEYFV